MYTAIVKPSSPLPVITACGGREFTKRESRQVPESELASAMANPFLEVTEVEVKETPPEITLPAPEPKKQARKPAPKAAVKAEEPKTEPQTPPEEG
jgi:hypothetical protein